MKFKLNVLEQFLEDPLILQTYISSYDCKVSRMTFPNFASKLLSTNVNVPLHTAPQNFNLIKVKVNKLATLKKYL